ncbi:hypothetical protein [Xanthomonas campestris]|uniref:YfhO family protein n=1 Tax=Xanthomonas campestris pv. papavericola TaxID=487881 RepID=A0AAJ2X3Y7_XANCA|nr:hypothetical protein [Xanthomonas campestris]MEC3888278.1 hypothetical protein [Xanthomonas campestris pv. papavericola]
MKFLMHRRLPLNELSAFGFVLLGTGLLVYWILGRSVLTSNPAAVDIFLPMAFDSSRLARDYGVLAMGFNPYLLAGYSNWINANFNPFYPFFFNWLGSDASSADTLFRLEWVVRLHLLILALGSYLLARQTGARRWTAACCACMVPWLPGIQTTLGWTHIIASLAWVPWILAAQLRIARAPRFDILAVCILAACSSLLVYAQPAQNLVLTVVGSLSLWAGIGVCLFRQSNDYQTATRSIVTNLLTATFIIILCCAYYLVNLWEFQKESIRWIGAFGHVIGAERVPIEALKEFSIGPRATLSLISYKQEYSGHPGNLFVGLPLLFLAGYAVIQVKDIAVRGLACAALVAVALTLTAVVSISYWIPLVNKIREVTWWSCLWLIAVVPLAARGLDALVERWGEPGRWKSRGPLMAAAFLAGGLIALWLIENNLARTTLVLTCLFIAALLAIGASNSFLSRRSRVLLAPLLALVSILPMVLIFPRAGLAESYHFSASHIFFRQEALRLSSLIPSADRLNYRAGVDQSVDNYKLITHALANQDLRMIRGDIHPQLYSKFQLLYFPNKAVQRLYGIRYRAKTQSGTGAGPLHWETIDDPRPRLYFRPYRPAPVASPSDTLQAETGEQVLRDLVGKDAPTSAALVSLPADGPIVINPTLRQNSATRVRAVLSAPSAGVLVLNEDVIGHWHARINHQPQKPFALNGFQSGFVVPAAGLYEIDIQGGY